jgi:hypothetical protein
MLALNGGVLLFLIFLYFTPRFQFQRATKQPRFLRVAVVRELRGFSLDANRGPGCNCTAINPNQSLTESGANYAIRE